LLQNSSIQTQLSPLKRKQLRNRYSVNLPFDPTAFVREFVSQPAALLAVVFTATMTIVRTGHDNVSHPNSRRLLCHELAAGAGEFRTKAAFSLWVTHKLSSVFYLNRSGQSSATQGSC